MEFSRIKPDGLEKSTLKAEYYGNEFRRAADAVGRFSHVRTLDTIRIDDSPIRRGIDMPRVVNSPDSPLLVTIAAFTEPGLDFTSLEHIDRKQHLDFRGSCLATGDLLVAMGGYIGAAAIVPADCPEANIGRHTARVVIDGNKADKYFVWAYIRSRIGTLLFSREITGSVQAGINLEDLRTVAIPLPSSLVQKYIGNMVRSAETLQRFAHYRERQFIGGVSRVLINLNHHCPKHSKHERAKVSELNGSLNPGAFEPDRVYVRNYLRSAGAQRVGDIATIETPVTTSYRASDMYIGLDSIGSGLGRIAPSTIESENVTGSVRVLTEGPVISKLRPYLNKVAYIPTHLASSLGSTELLCVRANNDDLNWYLCGVLQLPTTVRQLNPVSTGSTHPRVSRQDVLDCYVPWIEDAANVGRLLSEAQEAYFLGDKMVAAAKLLVESLIERKITEGELATAQTLLELGDQSADREILRRLYEAGIDAANATPLFPDLDAYYQTQRVAEQALADGGDV